MNSAKRINQIRNSPGTIVWQRNYYERIVRDKGELEQFRKYIANNPEKWREDEENPEQAIKGDIISK
jgi:REP element-mobilizing transposase RayT